jgi:small-conductance mechanosensitive channel
MDVAKLKTQREQLVEQRRQLEGQHAFMTGRISQIDEIIKESEMPEPEEQVLETAGPVNGHAETLDG